MLEIGIISAPRPVYYLGNSLDSYFHQWTIKPHVFHEPNCPGYLNKSKVYVHENETTKGCVYNWLDSATWMLENTSQPFIMMCEDDILWIDGARKSIDTLLKVLTGQIPNTMVLDKLPLSKIGFISPYCSDPNAPAKTRGKRDTGWRPARYRSAGWCGALSLIFPRASLEKLVRNRERFIEYATWTPDSLRRVNKFTGPVFLDYSIGKIMFHDEALKLITHYPSHVQHLGIVSTFASNNRPENLQHPSRQAAV
jgi:hypothetical protein